MTIVRVTEIVRRLDQGMTRPYLVRGDDEILYVAKGRDTTQRGLIAEWICAHLARALDLSIPAFTLLDVPAELVDAMGAEGVGLGAGIVFGSRQEANVQEFAVTQLKRIDEAKRQRLLAFDWWIENGDRSLTPHGGNPNLLWQAANNRVLVIDHNLAFDEDFDSSIFFETHVFRDDANAVFGDLIRQLEMSALLSEALTAFDAAVATLPPAWYWVDVVQTIPVQVDLTSIRARLVTRAGLSLGSQP